MDNLIIVGATSSTDFPTTNNAFSPDFLGGSNDPWPSDIFVTKISSNGSDVLYSTFLGGSQYYEYVRAVAIDSFDRIHLTGWTGSPDFPVTADAADSVHDGILSYSGDGGEAFFTVLNSEGSTLNYSTFLGGATRDEGFDIHINNLNQIFIVGDTSSSDFPIFTGSWDNSSNGDRDIFVIKIDLGIRPTDATTFLPTTTIISTTSSQSSSVVPTTPLSSPGFLILEGLLLVISILLSLKVQKKIFRFKKTKL